MADKIGKMISPKSPETIAINGILMPIDHSLLAYRFIYYGLYEEHFVRFLQRVIRPGDVVIEPGVNIGYITAVLLGQIKPHGKIIALEPSRICFERIRNYLISQNIILLNKALSNQKSTATFVDKKIVISHGYSSLAEFAQRDNDDEVYDIEIETVDTLCSEYRIDRLRFLKLDIEGGELAALQGAVGMIVNKKIDYILVETTFAPGFDKINMDIYTMLSGCGYVPYVLARNSIRPIDFVRLKNTRKDIIWTYLEYGKN